MPGIPFIKDFKFDYGTAMEVTPLIRRVVANNPSPFTFKGTSTYIVGVGRVAIIDPGPDDEAHFQALLKAEMASTQKLGRQDLPTSLQAVDALLDEARQHGAARVVNTLLPGVGGFCAPVFDADGHMVLGMVALGSMVSFDPAFDGQVATPLKAAAKQLSSDLGYVAA